jgi:hypothetical protein
MILCEVLLFEGTGKCKRLLLSTLLGNYKVGLQCFVVVKQMQRMMAG